MSKKFKLFNHLNIEEAIEQFKNGEDVYIPTSDLSVQNGKDFLQFQFINDKTGKIKTKLRPGIFNLESTQQGIVLVKTEFPKLNLLESSSVTSSIKQEINTFFDKIEVYKQLGIPPRRGCLIYGPPGVGKTTAIGMACNEMKGKGACIVTWNASSIRSSDILDFFTTGVEYSKSTKRLILIIEDIGMSVENYGGPREIDRSLLNLLDGAANIVQIPTLNIATTNYAHNLPEPLVRPGRFDSWIEAKLPNAEERVKLIEFISKTELTEADKQIIMSKELDSFSAAHLKELSIRSLRDGKTVGEVVKELKDHQKRFKNSFEDKKGFGLL
jgi:SpoVK/Ycf46/Vps4 family AAA+-type ATPase